MIAADVRQTFAVLALVPSPAHDHPVPAGTSTLVSSAGRHDRGPRAELDLAPASVDGSHLRALKGGDATGPSPVDRGKTGSKHHVIVDVHGMPLAATVTGGNRNDVTQRLPLIHAVPPIRGNRGRSRQRPDVLYADRGYDHNVYRRQVHELGIRPLIARRGTEHGSGLGKNRWVVEAAFALLRWFRRLRIRWEIRADIHQAFLTLGCAIICWRRLKKQC
ncbi:transposase [Streptomyces sp. TE5632]